MKRITFFKTLLLAAGLSVGASAWGQGYYKVWENDFETQANIKSGWTYSADASMSHNWYSNPVLGGHAYLIKTDNGKSRTCTYTLTSQSTEFTSTSDYIFEMDLSSYGSNNSGNYKGTLKVLGANDVVLLEVTTFNTGTPRFYIGAYSETNTNYADLTMDANSSSTRDNLNCNHWYHFTFSSNATNGTKVKIEQWSNATTKTLVKEVTLSANLITMKSIVANSLSYGQIAFDNFALSVYRAEELVASPTSSITSVNGSSRFVTIKQDEAASIWYNTDGGESYIQYTTPIEITQNTTLYYYAQSSSGTKSTVASATYSAGTTVSLNKAAISLTSVTNNGTNLTNPIYRIDEPNNLNVLCSPVTETLAYTFTPQGGAESARTTISSGATYTPVCNGTLKVYATTTGYEESCLEFPVSNYYSVSYSTDFSAYTESPFGENTNDVTSTWWTTAYRNTSSGSTTLGRVRFGNNTVTDLVIGYGIGRAGSGCQIQLRCAKVGNIDVLTINNTNNSGINSGTYDTNVLETSGSGKNTDLSSQLYINSYNTLKVHTTFTPSSPALADGSAIHLTFDNAGTSGANDNNWKLNFFSENTKVANVRADWWDEVVGNNTLYTYGYTYSSDGGATADNTNVWATFQSDMTDADVDLTLSYTEGTLYVIGTMTHDQKVYYVNYKKSGLSGDLTYNLYGNNATLSNIVTTDASVTTNPAHPTAIKTTIGSTGYSTFTSTLYPLDLSVINGATAFYATGTTTDKVKFAKTEEEVSTGVGLLLKGAASQPATIKIADEGTTISGNLLVGCTTETVLDANANYYVMVKNNDTAEFQCLNLNGATIPAGKAYLNVAAGAGARLSFSFDDDTTTGISSMHNSEFIMHNEVYNLNGQRIVKPSKGLYIVNGKKYFNK